MINRFALSFLCIELDRDKICEVMLLYIPGLTSSVRYCGNKTLPCTVSEEEEDVQNGNS